MEINVNIKVDEEGAMNPEKTEVASGWVEIENCIKFPIRVRKYKNEEGEEKMFVTYPQRKNGAKYEGIIYPHDRAVRKEIEARVLEEVGNEVVKDINLPSVEAVRVSLVKQMQMKEAAVKLRGVATLKIAGMTINGITIKEGQKGLFVQMPQYKSGGEYKDTVYGTNAGIHALIKEEVLKAYREVVKEEQIHQEEQREQHEEHQEEQTEQHEEHQEPQEEQTEQREQEQQETAMKTSFSESAIDRFIHAFEMRNVQEMLHIFKETETEVVAARFMKNYNAVRLQGAALYDENRMVDFSFHNSWNPLQQIPPSDYLTQKIEARIYEDGNIKGMTTLVERKSKSLKNAEKNYNEMLSMWMELTKQEKIEIPREQEKREDRTEKKHIVPGL